MKLTSTFLHFIALTYAALTLPYSPIKFRVGPDFALIGDWSPGLIDMYSLSSDTKTLQSFLGSVQVQTNNFGDFDYEVVQDGNQWYAFQVSNIAGLQVVRINSASSPYLTVCAIFPGYVGESISIDYNHKFLYVMDFIRVHRFDISDPCHAQLLHSSSLSTSSKILGPYATALTNGFILRIDGPNIGKVDIKTRQMTNETIWAHPEIPNYFRSVAGYGNIGYYAPEQNVNTPTSLYVVNLTTGQTIYKMPIAADPKRPLIQSGPVIGFYNVNQYLIMLDRTETGSGKFIRVFDFTNPTDPQFVMMSSFVNGTGSGISDAFFLNGNVYACGAFTSTPIQNNAFSVFANPNATVIQALMDFFKQDINLKATLFN